MKRLAAYVHPAPAPEHAGCDCAANPPGTAYYTSARDHGRYVALSGPFATHVAALEALPAARAQAYELDPRAPWYAYGTFAAKPGATVRPVLPAGGVK